MKKIKYKYITKNAVKLIFWTGGIVGATLWASFGGLAAANPLDALYPGLRDVGLVLVAGTIGFAGGLMLKVRE